MKKIFITIIIFILVVLIVPVSVYLNNIKTKTITTYSEEKYINSSEVGLNVSNNTQYKVVEEEDVKEESNNIEENKVIENNNNEKKNVTNNNTTANNNVSNVQQQVQTQPVQQQVVEQPVVETQQVQVSDVLETQVGKLTSYGPDCPGCSGRVSYGQDVTNGNIYYNDKTYGKIRIVAGDRSYKLGTIVRIKNSRAGSNIIAIILDRGGSVGFGKATLFDLLYETNAIASRAGTSNNVTFEILRYGF